MVPRLRDVCGEAAISNWAVSIFVYLCRVSVPRSFPHLACTVLCRRLAHEMCDATWTVTHQCPS